MFEKLKEILPDYVEVDPDTITPDTQFLRDLKMNSYDIVTLIGQVEEEFDITIDGEDMKDIVTVGDMARYLSEKI